MNININEKVCEDNNLSVAKVLALAAIQYSTQEVFQKLNKERFLLDLGSSIFNEETKYKLSRKANEALSCILALLIQELPQ